MKKYKLIKTYPGSPPLNTTAIKGLGIEFTYPDGSIKGKCSSTYDEFKVLIENQPEYWQEVVEQEYEILIYKGFISKSLYKLSSDGYYYNDVGRRVTSTGDYYIHSVKRLSDGEIFTVGDTIKGYETDTNPFVITNIFILNCYSENKLCFSNYPEHAYPKNGRSAYLTSIIKVKKPLFTTNDGVEMYLGDKYYSVFKADVTIYQDNKTVSGPVDQENHVFFSSKEKSDKYRLFNKPCLSINDVMNAGYGICNSHALEKIVKSKLK